MMKVLGPVTLVSTRKRRIERIDLIPRALLLASHSDELLRRFCRRGFVFDGGRLVFHGPLESALEFYHRNHHSFSASGVAS